MKKGYIYTLFICFLMMFFFCGVGNVNASSVYIEELPVGESIDYGEPLFESTISGGKANVDGSFRWSNPELLLDAGEQSVEVVFDPDGDLYEEITFNINIAVNKRRVYLKFENDIYKQYDDSRDIVLPSYIVGGIRSYDGVYISGDLKGSLESGLVGQSTKVILEGIQLVGERKDNYYLDLSGFTATVYPKRVEKLVGDNNKIEFSSGVYVPIDSIINLEEIKGLNLVKDGYKINKIYDVYLTSNGSRVDVNGGVKVKVKIDENSFSYKRLEICNYYDGKYEEITEYKYENGYFIYEASSLGKIVFCERELNFIWLYYLAFSLIILLVTLVVVKKIKNRERINKYKSLKRRKDNGDY